MAMLTLMDRMGQDMQLRGLAGCTQAVYRGTVESVARFCGRPPNALDTLTEEEHRQYFLHLVHERQASRSTLRVRRAGLRFLVETRFDAPGPARQTAR